MVVEAYESSTADYGLLQCLARRCLLAAPPQRDEGRAALWLQLLFSPATLLLMLTIGEAARKAGSWPVSDLQVVYGAAWCVLAPGGRAASVAIPTATC